MNVFFEESGDFKVGTVLSTAGKAYQVELSNGTKCVSPCAVKLKRKDGFTVIARKEGYQDATAKVESKVKGGGVAGAAGNVIFGGIIGAAVDGSNGSMRDLTPNPLVMVLQPLSVPAVSGYSIGHIRDQFTIPMGIRATLATERQTVSLLEPAQCSWRFSRLRRSCMAFTPSFGCRARIRMSPSRGPPFTSRLKSQYMP